MDILTTGLLFLLLLPLGAILMIWKHKLDILFGLVMLIGFAGVFITYFKMLIAVYEKTKSKLLGICAPVFVYAVLGVPLRLFEMYDISSLMGTIQEKKIGSIGVLFGFIIILISFIVPVVVKKHKNHKIRLLVCVSPIVLTIVFYVVYAMMCIQTGSTNMVTEMEKRDDLVSYEVKENADIYYTGSKEQKETIHAFPMLSPIKYSSKYFEKGETVWVDVNSWKGLYRNREFLGENKDDPLDGREYVLATNGEIAGYIKTATLIK